MRLSELIAALPSELAPAQPLCGSDPVVRGIKYDSRDVAPGDLFVALRGAAFDGHGFVEQAVAQGAVALLVEALPDRVALEGRAAVSVPDTRRALGPIAECFFGAPARELQLVGVTGTNGKTSTTYLIESMLTACGRRCGLIGTIEIRYAGERLREQITDSDRDRLLDEFIDRIESGADASAGGARSEAQPSAVERAGGSNGADREGS